MQPTLPRVDEVTPAGAIGQPSAQPKQPLLQQAPTAPGERRPRARGCRRPARPSCRRRRDASPSGRTAPSCRRRAATRPTASRRGEATMSPPETARLAPALSEEPERDPLPTLDDEPDYLRAGKRHRLVAQYARSQAHRAALLRRRAVHVHARRRVRAGAAHRASHARSHDHGRHDLQPHVHAARHHHGLALSDPVDPERLRKFRAADPARRARPRVPQAQPHQLLRLRHRRRHHARRHVRRRRRHRLDLLHALQRQLADARRARRHRRVRRRHLDDLHRL